MFLVGLEEEILPHKRSIYEDFSVDEERRLCYVGITRARRQLVISRCLCRKKYGKLEERAPSRFLAEIPAELVNQQEGDEGNNAGGSGAAGGGRICADAEHVRLTPTHQDSQNR